MSGVLGHIQVVEVGPRDGLQNEAVVLGTADKRELVLGTIAAGARRIEVTSFVNPAVVPQMAGGEELLASLPREPGLKLHRTDPERSRRTASDRCRSRRSQFRRAGHRLVRHTQSRSLDA